MLLVRDILKPYSPFINLVPSIIEVARFFLFPNATTAFDNDNNFFD